MTAPWPSAATPANGKGARQGEYAGPLLVVVVASEKRAGTGARPYVFWEALVLIPAANSYETKPDAHFLVGAAPCGCPS